MDDGWAIRLYGNGGLDEYHQELLKIHIHNIRLLNTDKIESYVACVKNPVWKLVKADYSDDWFEVSTGMEVRDPSTLKFIRVSWVKKLYPIISYASSAGGKSCIFMLHKAIGKAFVDNDDPANKTIIHHIDGNRWNNVPWNLEWVSENEHKLLHYGRGDLVSGEKHHWADYTDDEIEHVCQLLQNRTDMSYQDISKATGVDWHTVGSVYRGETRKKISSKYKFPHRSNTVYTDEQIHSVCQLLCDRPDLTYKQISELVDMDENVIEEINNGRRWLHITMNYKFPKRDSMAKGESHGMAKYTNEQVIEVCCLLRDHPDKTYKEISDLTGVSVDIIKRIYGRKNWTSISKDYVFPPRETRVSGENNGISKITNDQAIQICELLDQVYLGKIKMSHPQIAERCGATKVIVDNISKCSCWENVAKNYAFYQNRRKGGGGKGC